MGVCTFHGYIGGVWGLGQGSCRKGYERGWWRRKGGRRREAEGEGTEEEINMKEEVGV